jgi:integrase
MPRVQGIEPRHKKSCRSRLGGRCNCTPTYQASVYDKATGIRERKTFETRTEAENWRRDRIAALKSGRLRMSRITVRDIGDELIDAIKEGAPLGRGRKVFSPGTVASYEYSWKHRIREEFGGHRLADLDRTHINRFIDKLGAQGLSGNTIANDLLPLRLIVREAMRHGHLATTPFAGVETPQRGKADIRVVSPMEMETMLAALTGDPRAVYAIGAYAGLRIGEIAGLKWSDIDLSKRTITVRRNWVYKTNDLKECPKTDAGRRTIPVIDCLFPILADHRSEHSEAGETDFVFPGRFPDRPRSYSGMRFKADRLAGAGVVTLRPHECRHSFASFMIAAGVNLKALSVAMGHTNVGFTLDRYGHLLPDAHEEMTERLNDFLSRTRSR